MLIFYVFSRVGERLKLLGASGYPRRTPGAPRSFFNMCFHVPERPMTLNHTCFYMSERLQEAPGSRFICKSTCESSPGDEKVGGQGWVCGVLLFCMVLFQSV